MKPVIRKTEKAVAQREVTMALLKSQCAYVSMLARAAQTQNAASIVSRELASKIADMGVDVKMLVEEKVIWIEQPRGITRDFLD